MFLRNKNKKILLILFCIFLNGCSKLILMDPKGNIGLEQKKLIIISLFLMLLIVIPVIIITIYFSTKYRSSNIKSKYEPNWSKSNRIELLIWIVPILIIFILASLTLKSTYKLDPKHPISHIKPINIEVISLDWRWLFIYPDYNIATINEIYAPKNIPIKFNITSNSVMNSFFIPQLGSQIYAMAGMNSILNLIANTPGIYKGISSNFSGKGFSDMKFKIVITENFNEFNKWVNTIKLSKKTIKNINEYNKITIPTLNSDIEYYSNIKPNLFQDIINKFIH